MRPSVDVVVPWRGGCPHRERAWGWVRQRLEATGYRVVVAETPPGPWIKADAVMPAVRESSADVVVVHDADVWCDGLPDAVEAVRTWGLPHRPVFRLTEQASDAYMEGASLDGLETVERPMLGMLGGGIMVLRREVALDVPMDPRFVGWGQEDESWARALETLVGRPWRGRAQLVHLWHPPQERTDRRRGSRENWRLLMRYAAARRNPEAMRALLEEVTACSLS